MTTGAILGAALVVASLTACGGGDAAVSSSVVSTVVSSPTTFDTVPSTLGSTSSAPTGTAPASVVTSTSVATSTMVATSTTVEAAAVLVLGPDGLGDARFGTDPDAVIGYLVAIVGPPTGDSGWVSAAGPFGVCPGDDVREVSWGDLKLLFGDTSQVTDGRRHFFHYEYGPAGRITIEPVGLVTTSAVGVGTTLTELFAVHPDAEVVSADEIGGPYFVLADGLFGQLSGTESVSVIQSVAAGVGCGE